MSNTLIIALDHQNLINVANVVYSMRAENPHQSISLATDIKNSPFASLLVGISKTFFLDKDRIKSLIKNKIFSKSIPMNELLSYFEDVSSEEWDKVVNTDNNIISTALCSYVSSYDKCGIQKESPALIKVSHELSVIEPISNVNSYDSIHKIANVIPRRSGIKIQANQETNQIVTHHFNEMRKKYQVNSKENIKILGIDIMSLSGMSFSLGFLKDITSLLISSKNYLPIFLVDKSDKTKSLINKLNEKFNDKLISTELEIKALPSVLINIDLLLTSTATTRMISDLCDTPSLEVNSNYINYNNFSSNSESLVLSKIEQNEFEYKEQEFILDLYESILYYFDSEYKPNMSGHSTLYSIKKDQSGLSLNPIWGNISPESEINYQVARILSDASTNSKDVKKLNFDFLKQFTSKEINSWASNEKRLLTDTLKIILSTLRSLKYLRISQNNAVKFITNLDQLIDMSLGTSPQRILNKIFEFTIENPSLDSDNPYAHSENSLFEYKKKLQEYNGMLNHIISVADQKSKEKIQNKLLKMR